MRLYRIVLIGEPHAYYVLGQDVSGALRHLYLATVPLTMRKEGELAQPERIEVIADDLGGAPATLVFNAALSLQP